MVRPVQVQLVTWRQAGSARTSDPHAELALLARSNLFIGNCVSSFTAVVVRERRALGLPSEFWAFPPDSESESPPRLGRDTDEL